MTAREAAEQEARHQILEYVDPALVAERAVAGQPVGGGRRVELRQRGRTGRVTAFDPQKHPRGEHGRFARGAGGGQGQQGRAAQPKHPRTPDQIKAFQKAYGLPQSGQLDAGTRATLAAPPPMSLDQMRRHEAEEKAKASATQRQESRAKSNARRKEEGKPPVGSTSSPSSASHGGGSTGSTTAAPAHGAQRSALVAAEKVVHDTGNQRLAEAIRAQIGGHSSSGGGSHSRARGGSARAKGQQSAKGQQVAAKVSGEAWTGHLSPNEDLKLGTGMTKTGPDASVGLLQAKVQALGYDLGPAGVDGKFGKATQTAVRVLQREYGLRPDGVVGPDTLQLLETLTQRAQQWQRHGIIAAEVLPRETPAAVARSVVAVLSACK